MIVTHIAIRALPDLCLGITSGRLEFPLGVSLLETKPRHARGFLLLTPPALGERRHRGLPTLGIAVRRRAVFMARGALTDRTPRAGAGCPRSLAHPDAM